LFFVCEVATSGINDSKKFSAVEMLHDSALYKFMIDIDIDIDNAVDGL